MAMMVRLPCDAVDGFLIRRSVSTSTEAVASSRMIMGTGAG